VCKRGNAVEGKKSRGKDASKELSKRGGVALSKRDAPGGKPVQPTLHFRRL